MSVNTLVCGFCGRIVTMCESEPVDPRWFRDGTYECNGCASERYKREWDAMTDEERTRAVEDIEAFFQRLGVE